MRDAVPAAAARAGHTVVDTPPGRGILAVRRIVTAPRPLLFQAFADPTQVDRWFGPEGFRNTTHEHDFRVGGVWRHTMHGPDGTDYPNKSVFVEIDPPERIEWDQGWDRADFEPLHRSSITLREEQGGTEVELRLVFPTVAARDAAVQEFGAVEGATHTLARLAGFVAAKQA